MIEVRCPACGRKLASLKGVGEFKCNKCKNIVYANTDTRKVKIVEHQKRVPLSS